MRKIVVVIALAGAVGCVPTEFLHRPDLIVSSDTPPSGDPYHTLDFIRDDAEHDRAATGWCRRLLVEGRDLEAIEVATRLRDDAARQLLLAELQADPE